MRKLDLEALIIKNRNQKLYDLDLEYTRAVEYMPLYKDILDELSACAKGREILLYDYIEALGELARYYMPMDAFIAGTQYAGRYARDQEALTDHILTVNARPDVVECCNRITWLRKQLNDLLDGKTDIIAEITRLFWECETDYYEYEEYFWLGLEAGPFEDDAVTAEKKRTEAASVNL